MYIAPDSTIEFYETNLDKSYNDTLYFKQGGAGIAAQREYFNSVLRREIDNNSYIRKGVGVIYVELPISELYKYDYMGLWQYHHLYTSGYDTSVNRKPLAITENI